MATGSSDREIKISVVVDANGAVKALTQLGDETKKAGKAAEESGKGFTKFEAGIVSLNQGLELAKKGFSFISNSFNQLSSALSRGDQFNSLTQNIRQLTSEAGKLSDAFEQRLFKAIDGNITNFDALKTSVGGLQLGLDQNLILDYAASADKLGDAVGISAADAFNTLVNAVGKHNARLLESVGISLDGIDVNQRYANSIGVSVRDLTEQQKAEAQSVASKELIKIKLSELANVSSGAGENLGKVSNQITNITDAAYASLDSNQQLAAAFQNLFNTLKGFDWNVYLITPLTNVINTVANVSQNLQNIQAAFLASSLKSVTFKDQLLALNGAMKESFKSGKDFNEALQENGALAKAVILNYGTLSSDLKTKFAPNVQFLTKALNGEITALKKTDTEVKKTNKGHKDYGDTNRALNKTLSEQIDLLNKSSAEVEKLDKALADGLISPQQFDEALQKISKELIDMGFNAEQATNVVTKGLDAGTDAARNLDKKLGEIEFLSVIRDQANEVSNILDGIQGIEGIVGGIDKNEIASVVAGISTLVGTIVGSIYGAPAQGAAAGAAVGAVLGPLAEVSFDAFGLSDSKATKLRKKLDGYFDDLFNANRISVVINGQLKRLNELTFSGKNFGNATEGFYDEFNKLDGAAKDAFRAVATAFGQLNGVAASVASTFGAVFAANIGGSLNNLQLLVEASGVSFEELGSQIEKAFLNGELSITQARLALIGLEKTAQKGIPEAVGVADQAFQNLIDAGLNGGRASVDALKDIVYEAKEAGITNFSELRKFIRDSGDFSSKEIKALFGALKDIGVSNFDQLTSASLSTIIAVLTQFNSRGGFDEATAKLEDTATAINNVPSEKKVKFIIDVDYTDRAKSLTAQAALANINAPTVKRAEGVR